MTKINAKAKKIPLFGKEGLGEIRFSTTKNPSQPPFPKGRSILFFDENIRQIKESPPLWQRGARGDLLLLKQQLMQHYNACQNKENPPLS
ncbi:MAG: hypothetical protein Q7S87_12525 [Agitococcus sp.]|nr:hypothetical protein [Agitococcus sp.]